MREFESEHHAHARLESRKFAKQSCRSFSRRKAIGKLRAAHKQECAMPARFRPRDRVWQCHRGEIRTRHEAALRESGERTWPVAYLLMCKSIAHARGVGAAARLDIARKFTSGDWESFPHGSSARSLP